MERCTAQDENVHQCSKCQQMQQGLTQLEAELYNWSRIRSEPAYLNITNVVDGEISRVWEQIAVQYAALVTRIEECAQRKEAQRVSEIQIWRHLMSGGRL